MLERMDSTALWLLVLSISTPVAAVVGFAIQLRQVRNSKLENEKLRLEIAALKVAAEAQERRVQSVSTDEVLCFGKGDFDGPMFSRGPNPGPDDGPVSSIPRSKLKDALVLATFFVFAFGFVAYALYDVFRFIRWVAHAL
jgi:hypothetical protein